MSVWVNAIDAARIAVKMPIAPTTTHRVRGVGEDRARPGDEVDAGVDHRRGVDQGRDRRRALHRVGQPDVERELGALAHAPAKTSSAIAAIDDRGRASPILLEDATWTLSVPEADEDQHDPEREADVADAVDDERLLRRQGRRPLALYQKPISR